MRSNSWFVCSAVTARYRNRPSSTGRGISLSCSMKRTDNPMNTCDIIDVTRVSRTLTILHHHRHHHQQQHHHHRHCDTYRLSRALGLLLSSMRIHRRTNTYRHDRSVFMPEPAQITHEPPDRGGATGERAQGYF